MSPSLHTPRTYIAVGALLCVLGLVGATRAESPSTPLDDLAFLAGEWERVAPDGGVFTAHYTGPEGGRILGMTKQVERDQVTFFEFETIAAVGTQVVLTPYPSGRPAASFTLAGRATREAVFVNPKNDFPRRIRYALTARGALAIDLHGVERNRKISMSFELFPRSR